MEPFFYALLLALALGLAVSILSILVPLFSGTNKEEPAAAPKEDPAAYTAVVACSGIRAVNPDVLDYQGPSGCAAKIRFFSGPYACSFSCLGGGDCAAACPQHAISIREGLAVIDRSLCNGCGWCTTVCPRGLISVTDRDRVLYTGCNASMKDKLPGSVCKAGCTACGECASVCPENAITFEKNLPVIDRSLCTYCGRCAQVCPTDVLRTL
ncbi:MAG: 4Fe-4S binding protein [Firmicutes bacterium]|nr:4Fe-4S binding protein [Bacillota bacterium]